MRLAGHMAEVVQSDGFERRWLSAETESQLTDVLVRDDHFLHIPLSEIPALASQTGSRIGDLDLPPGLLIALIERGDKTLIASNELTLEAGDIVALIGEPEAVDDLQTGPATG
jgi:Trk K+ transport system NAD-binding subunit